MTKNKQFKKVGKIGNKKVITSVHANKKIPMNSFKSRLYYITTPNEPNRIVAIAFYNRHTHKIVKSIDLIYDKSGNLIPFKQVKRKGKIRIVGTHTHSWSENKENGKMGRKSHDKKNFSKPTQTDKKFIKKALKFNLKHQDFLLCVK